MTVLTALETLYDAATGDSMPLPPELARVYGQLRVARPPDRPYVLGNFVSTLDGVTAFDDPLRGGAGEISGHNAHDRMLMGLLRAVSDAVVVGAGTLRAEPRHVWTAERAYPDLAREFAALRHTLGLAPQPLNVFVSASGQLDFGMPVFQDGVPVLVVSTARGAAHMRKQSVPDSVRLVQTAQETRVTAAAVLAAIEEASSARVVLLEGGPRLMGDFFGERKLDELFLTVAPQVAGRHPSKDRPGLVAGRLFAPDDPLWGRLVSVRRADSYLLLRYAFS